MDTNLFDDLCNHRQKTAGDKYLMPDGTNQAMFRNCPLDVAEELSDAHNILELWTEKIKRTVDHHNRPIGSSELNPDALSMFQLGAISSVDNMICELGRWFLELAEDCKDEIPVERILPESLEHLK